MLGTHGLAHSEDDLSAAGPNAPLALAAWMALVACRQDDPSPIEVREQVAAERREGRREVAAARASAERELARADAGGDASADSDWIHSGPSGATYSRDPAVLQQTRAHGALIVQTEQAEAAFEIAHSACQADTGELREACVRDAERDHRKRLERAHLRFRRATMQESAMP